MMRLRPTLLLLMMAVSLAGCHKKRPKAQPPAQAQTVPQGPAPQITLPPIPTPPQIAATQPPPQQNPAPVSPQKKPAHKVARKPKSPATTTSTPEPTKTATATSPPPVNTPEPEVTTSSGSDVERESKEWLDDTDSRINALTRQRSPSDDEVVTIQQIRSYEKDAQDALRQKDFARAHTLAQKAHLLAVTLTP